MDGLNTDEIEALDAATPELDRPHATSLTHSVVIPTKNRPNLLLRAVRSALAGLADEGEVLVIDDDSLIPAKVALCDFFDPRLRIIRLPKGTTGVSNARNAGIVQAQGDVIFFLDDDDELLPGYCRHVLDNGASDHDYGFSTYLQASAETSARTLKPPRFAQGAIPTNARLGRRLCGFGMGFWIWRRVALEQGLVSTDLSINEDTEYLCRLITACKNAWYSTMPGVVLYDRSAVATDDITHLTHRVCATERARCMMILCTAYPHMATYLGFGYIRHCLKSGAIQEAQRFATSQCGWQKRLRMRVFIMTKIITYRLTGRLGQK